MDGAHAAGGSFGRAPTPTPPPPKAEDIPAGGEDDAVGLQTQLENQQKEEQGTNTDEDMLSNEDKVKRAKTLAAQLAVSASEGGSQSSNSGAGTQLG